MSSTGIDRVVNTLRLSLSLGAVERPLPGVTNCRFAQPVSTGVQATGCRGQGSGAVGWRAPCTWDATSPVTTPRERRRGATTS